MAENPLVGTWRLVSFEVQEDEDGRVDRPFGPDPVGFITYAADGHMQVQFGRADRPHLGGDWLAAAEAGVAVAARDYFAYCGTYEYRDGEVVHRIQLSLMPDWIGGEQVRRFTLAGDIATLTTPPTPVGGRQQRATLVWQRA